MHFQHLFTAKRARRRSAREPVAQVHPAYCGPSSTAKQMLLMAATLDLNRRTADFCSPRHRLGLLLDDVAIWPCVTSIAGPYGDV